MAKADDIFNRIPQMSYQEPRPATDPAAFGAILKARRSVRVFNGTPVPETVMREVLEWALLAPNSSNLQPWEFLWVRNPQKKEALQKACFNQPAARTAAELIVVVAHTNTWRKNARQMLAQLEAAGDKAPQSALSYYRKLVPFVYTQGFLGSLGFLKRLLFFFRGFKAVTPREPVSHADMRVWAVKSSALTCENIMLGLSAHGFDSCPMEGYDSWRVRSLFDLKKGSEVVMVIAAGQRADNGVYGPRVRFPYAQFVREIL